MKVEKLWFDEKYVNIRTDDGRIGRLLIALSPRLSRATPEERGNYRIMRGGIHWSAVDEDIAFDSFFEDRQNAMGVSLGAVPEYLSMSYIAQRFFGKSRSWLHNKINGNLCNGKPAELSQDDKEKMKEALLCLSKEIEEIAMEI